jgi:DNA-binding NarL/FixJ family response regulator
MTEQRVGTLVAAGHSDLAIASRLALTAQTVEWNVAKLSERLGVGSRAELVAALDRLRRALEQT